MDSDKKYLNLPSPEQGNFILFSMTLSLEELESLIEKFPQFHEKDSRGLYQLARSCTVSWSGSEGYNVPILPWSKASVIGVVINPEKIDAPYGDIIASASLDRIPYEASKSDDEIGSLKAVAKTEEEIDHGYKTKTKKHTKYKGKIVVERALPEVIQSSHAPKIITNLTRISKKDGYHEVFKEGSIEVFAENIWRKYFKRKFEKTNEVLCIQKIDATNPIVGIFWDVTDGIKGWNNELESTKDELIAIMNKSPQIDLYIYDRNQKEHIVRVVENKAAIEIIRAKNNFEENFVKDLPPYKGISKHPEKPNPNFIKTAKAQNKKELLTPSQIL